MINKPEFDLVGHKIINLLENCPLDMNECHLVLVGLLASMQQLSSANVEEFWSAIKTEGMKLSESLTAGGRYDG